MSVKTVLSLVPLTMAFAISGCGRDEALPQKETSTTDTCHVDFINGDANRLVQIKAGQIDIRGWAFDKNTKSTPLNLDIILKDAQGKTTVFAGAKRGERPDVAKLFKQDEYLHSGFWLKADASSLTPGVYGITLKLYEGNREVLCGVKKNISAQS